MKPDCKRAFHAKGPFSMLKASFLALVALTSPPLQVGPDRPDTGSMHLAQVAPADSAHTLFVPAAPVAGLAGEVYHLPGGGTGISTGGTAQYQTLAMPGGSAVAFPNGNGTSDVIGPGSGSGLINAPR
jgi:hypothetical protein